MDQNWDFRITLLCLCSYCSPEYAFPTQQEVINFAANTAFELVTLNPRTLVVCGSYSVGKEKVFLGQCFEILCSVFLSECQYQTTISNIFHETRRSM